MTCSSSDLKKKKTKKTSKQKNERKPKEIFINALDDLEKKSLNHNIVNKEVLQQYLKISKIVSGAPLIWIRQLHNHRGCNFNEHFNRKCRADYIYQNRKDLNAAATLFLLLFCLLPQCADPKPTPELIQNLPDSPSLLGSQWLQLWSYCLDTCH